MKIGDVTKARKLRSYFSGPEAHGYADLSADNGTRKREDQQVFVLMFLGIEPLYGDDGEIDCRRQLNALGFWGEDQLVEVMGKRAANALVKKLVTVVEEKDDRV